MLTGRLMSLVYSIDDPVVFQSEALAHPTKDFRAMVLGRPDAGGCDFGRQRFCIRECGVLPPFGETTTETLGVKRKKDLVPDER
jgi:hypothetical protein